MYKGLKNAIYGLTILAGAGCVTQQRAESEKHRLTPEECVAGLNNLESKVYSDGLLDGNELRTLSKAHLETSRVRDLEGENKVKVDAFKKRVIDQIRKYFNANESSIEFMAYVNDVDAKGNPTGKAEGAKTPVYTNLTVDQVLNFYKNDPEGLARLAATHAPGHVLTEVSGKTTAERVFQVFVSAPELVAMAANDGGLEVGDGRQVLGAEWVDGNPANHEFGDHRMIGVRGGSPLKAEAPKAPEAVTTEPAAPAANGAPSAPAKGKMIGTFEGTFTPTN